MRPVVWVARSLGEKQGERGGGASFLGGGKCFTGGPRQGRNRTSCRACNRRSAPAIRSVRATGLVRCTAHFGEGWSEILVDRRAGSGTGTTMGGAIAGVLPGSALALLSTGSTKVERGGYHRGAN